MAITATAVTTCSPAQVWTLLGDVESWPRWLPTVDSVTPEGPPRPDGPGVGSTYLLRQPRLPRARWTVTHWRPGEGFTWVSHAPGITSTATHELVTVDGATRIDLGIEWSGPLAWLLRLLYGRLTQRYVDTEAAALADGCRSAA
jgi:hypothetical protein